MALYRFFCFVFLETILNFINSTVTCQEAGPVVVLWLLDELVLNKRSQHYKYTSTLVFKKTTIELYNTLALPVLLCGSKSWTVNPLMPNDPYRGRTAPLTSKRCILYIYSTNIGTEYFKHGIYSSFFFSKCRLFHNYNVFGSCIIHIL